MIAKKTEDADREEEARNILFGIGWLLGRFGHPIVICFDRMENLDTPAQVRGFGKVVEFLVDACHAVLPIAFIRGMLWEEGFTSTQLNQQVVTRLLGNRFQLDGPNRDQALAIVENRLQAVLGDGWRGRLPFDPVRLIETFAVGQTSPRAVIMEANRKLLVLLEEPPFACQTPLETLSLSFDRQYETVFNHQDRHLPDHDRLQQALTLVLTHPESGAPIVRSTEGMVQVVDDHGDIQAGFFIHVESHQRSMGASLRRGISFLVDHPAAVVMHIRDARSPIPPRPRYPGTNDKLDEFEQTGGKVLVLDMSQVAHWYALTLLSYEVTAEDITDGQLQTVNKETFFQFIRERINGAPHPAFAILKKFLQRGVLPPPNSPRPLVDESQRAIAEQIERILSAIPAGMTTSQKLFEALDLPDHPTLTIENMLQALGRDEDRFCIFDCQGGPMVMLMKTSTV